MLDIITNKFIMKKSSYIYMIIIVAVIILSFLVIKYTMDASAISKLQVRIKSVQIQEIKVSYAKLKLNIENISGVTFIGLSWSLKTFSL